MNPTADEQLSRLLERAQDGDRQAYALFLAQARERVRALLKTRLHSPSLLDDVLQETLLSIHASRHSYDPARPIGPWLRAIALNRLRDLGRARQRHQAHAKMDLDWERTVHPSDAPDAASPIWMRAALRALSQAQREVLWLLKVEGYSVAEIALRTGRSPSAVKVSAHRAYRAMRQLLGSR